MIKRLVRILRRRLCPQEHANTGPFFHCLSALGYRPEHVVDIGAHKGAWTRSALAHFPEAQFTLFEPQRDLLETQRDLVRPNVRFFYMGVGPQSGTLKLTKSRRRDSYSFAWSEQEALAANREQLDVEVVALDSFLEENRLPAPSILKIDAEGWDLEVVKGAENAVRAADVVLLEAGVMNKRFKNTAHRIIDAMDSRGMVLFDITDLNRTPTYKGLWNVELAFVKKGGSLETAIDGYR